MNYIKLKNVWDKVQKLLDIDGDVVMLAFTATIVYRLLFGPPLNTSEAAVYASAIGCFAYSNKGGPKQS